MSGGWRNSSAPTTGRSPRDGIGSGWSSVILITGAWPPPKRPRSTKLVRPSASRLAARPVTMCSVSNCVVATATTAEQAAPPKHAARRPGPMLPERMGRPRRKRRRTASCPRDRPRRCRRARTGCRPSRPTGAASRCAPSREELDDRGGIVLTLAAAARAPTPIAQRTKTTSSPWITATSEDGTRPTLHRQRAGLQETKEERGGKHATGLSARAARWRSR